MSDAGAGVDMKDLPTGDLGLLETAVAQQLLASTELARVGFVAKDGTPRVLPMLFHWSGVELVFATFGGAKIAALRQRPHLAVTIDRATEPPRHCSCEAGRKSAR